MAVDIKVVEIELIHQILCSCEKPIWRYLTTIQLTISTPLFLGRYHIPHWVQNRRQEAIVASKRGGQTAWLDDACYSHVFGFDDVL
jgi:hypothetical protein